MTTIVTLPFPPSVNGTFRKFNGSRLAETYRAWRDEAGYALKAQKPRPLFGPVTVTMTVNPPDNRIRDLDNLWKGVLDLLVKHKLIEHDDMRIVVETHQFVDRDGPPCIVTVRSIQ